MTSTAILIDFDYFSIARRTVARLSLSGNYSQWHTGSGQRLPASPLEISPDVWYSRATELRLSDIALPKAEGATSTFWRANQYAPGCKLYIAEEICAVIPHASEIGIEVVWYCGSERDAYTTDALSQRGHNITLCAPGEASPADNVTTVLLAHNGRCVPPWQDEAFRKFVQSCPVKDRTILEPRPILRPWSKEALERRIQAYRNVEL